MKMHYPPHPGEVLKALCLEPLNVTGRAGISPEMAVPLSAAFNTSAESWLNQQLQYDLWHAERNRKRLHVTKLSAA